MEIHGLEFVFEMDMMINPPNMIAKMPMANAPTTPTKPHPKTAVITSARFSAKERHPAMACSEYLIPYHADAAPTIAANKLKIQLKRNFLTFPSRIMVKRAKKTPPKIQYTRNQAMERITFNEDMSFIMPIMALLVCRQYNGTE